MIDAINTIEWYELIWMAGAVLGFSLNFKVLLHAYEDRRAVIESEIRDNPNKESQLILANILLRVSRFFVTMLFGYIIIGIMALLTPSRPDLGDTVVNLLSLINFTFWMVTLEAYAIYWAWSYLQDRQRLSELNPDTETAQTT